MKNILTKIVIAAIAIIGFALIWKVVIPAIGGMFAAITAIF